MHYVLPVLSRTPTNRIFWAAGKNHVDMNYVHDQTMQKIVKYLREIWYGNAGTFVVTDIKNKQLVDCRKLWVRCLTIARTKFVPLCEGISGEVVILEVDDSFRYESINLPIDTLVVDLIRVSKEDDEFGESEFV